MSSSADSNLQLDRQLAHQAVVNLLDLYRMALRQEDIDRLQELLQPEATPASAHGQRHEENGAFITALELRENMTEVFRTLTVTNLDIPEETIQIAPDFHRITFTEAETVEDPVRFAARTRVFHTTWQLAREEAEHTVTFRIAKIHRAGPLFEVSTLGRVAAETPTRVTVTASQAMAPLAQVTVNVPGGEAQELRDFRGIFHGFFTPLAPLENRILQVNVVMSDASTMRLEHPYRLRTQGEQAVQLISGTAGTKLFSVALEPNGTVWAGGDNGGSLFQVLPGAHTATFIARLFENPASRVEDIVVDEHGRIHILFADRVGNKVIDSGVIVLAQGTFCRTVDISEAGYPFRAPSPDTGQLVPSVSTRAIAAGGRDIWLFGSDGGVARVADNFRDGICPEDRVEVQYDALFCRQGCQGEEGLLSNTVPAFVASADGTLGFGTALGFTSQRHDEPFTFVPFKRRLSLPENPATLERFFQQIAEAIFASRPLTTAGIGEVSFVDLFGTLLIKEDIIFSADEEPSGRFWLGTLGGGLRRIEPFRGELRDTFHLTRAEVVRVDPNNGARTVLSQQGIGSNIILALAAQPQGTIWAATDEGLSRIHENNGAFTVRNFSPLDGLAVPVRDVVVDAERATWLATDGGLFRLGGPGEQVRGVVQDATGTPISAADVLVPGTPFRTVTDASGQFTLHNLPPGVQQLLIDGRLATGGPFGSTCATLTTMPGEPTSRAVILTPGDATETLRLTRLSEVSQTVTVGSSVPLQVVVTDTQGQPVIGNPVTFLVTQGAGMLSTTCASTDVTGQASTTLTVTGGGSIRVQASLAGQGEMVFTVVGTVAGRGVRLVRLSAAQRTQPGEAFPEPFVMRMEDAFGNPLQGVEVTADIAGDGVLIDGNVMVTDAQGLVRFAVQAGSGGQDILVTATALGQTVQFLAIVGEVDTPDIPLDLAAAGSFVFIADRRSGLQIIDVGNPEERKIHRTLELDGVEVRLALDERRVYVATNFPLRLYILDQDRLINDPTARIEQIGLGRRLFPDDLQRHAITGVAVQEELVYVVTDARTENSGTLQVIDTRNLTGFDCRVDIAGEVRSLPGRPRGIAVSEGFAYVPAGEAGLLIFDISDPTFPTLLGAFGNDAPPAGTEIGFFSDIALTHNVAYLVETECDPRCDLPRARRQERFRVLDLRNPTAPMPRGAVATSMVTPVAEVAAAIAVDGHFAYLGKFAFGLQAIDISNPDAPQIVGAIDTPSQALNVATEGDFLYVSDQIFGLQVIRKPLGEALNDQDRDGTVDFFDVFPADRTEQQDTDRDGIGDHADTDDDNDGFPDDDELQANPRTDPTDPRDFPLRLPPPGTTTVVVDAASPFPPREVNSIPPRNGTPATPYRSITEGMRALRQLRENVALQNQVLTLTIRAGIYSPLLTQEVFPLDLSGLSQLVVRSVVSGNEDGGAHSVVIDAGFTGDILFLVSTREVMIAGLALQHGAHGLFMRDVAGITLRQNAIMENVFAGISIGLDARENTIDANRIDRNGQEGIRLFDNSGATITQNTVSNNGDDGIFIGFFDANAEIRQNTLVQNGDDGIHLAPDAIATVIGHNTIRMNGTFNTSSVGCIPQGAGINIASGSMVEEITENIVEANRSAGIRLVDSSMVMLISNNTITNNGEEGLRLFLDAFATITDNTIRGNGTNLPGIFGMGIRVDNTSNAEIVTNAIEDNRQEGIRIDNNSQAAMLGNVITHNGDDGIRLVRGASATVVGNTILGNGTNILGDFGNGIRVSINSTAELIADNIITGNRQFGLSIVSALVATVTGNTIDTNGRDGLFVEETPVELIGNTIVNNGDNGIELQLTTPFTVVRDNIIGGNTNGIEMRARAMASISGGSISRNEENGVLLVEASLARIGCEGHKLTLIENSDAGIRVSDDGSELNVNTEQIEFDGNGSGDIVGPEASIRSCPP